MTAPTNGDGVFVTLDGPGGVGKSTVAKALVEQLTTLGIPVHATREPTDTPLGNMARHGTETYRGLTMAHLIAADRHQHLITEIRPALARNNAVVVCDRYIASSLVLQRMDGLLTETVREINRNVDWPDLAVILTGDPSVIAHRLTTRGTHSRYELMTDSSFTEVRLYADAAHILSTEGVPTLVLNGTDSTPQELARIITARVTALRTEGAQ